MLSSKQLAYLRGLAHELKPVVLLGQKGITSSVVAEIKGSLLAHELIKVRLAAEDELDNQAQEAATQSDAVLCGRVGKMAILYARHPDKPRIRLPDDQDD
jgi:RNA-binding protein